MVRQWSAPIVKRFLIVSLLIPACAHQALDGADTVSPLPVKRVVLYQNGVGYFERGGDLVGDTLRLQVRPEQINDLLTSLTVIDLEGGRSQSISLPIEKSAAQRLDELPDQVRRQGGIHSLLAAFRGARVRLELRDEGTSIQGRIVGVESIDGKPHVALASGARVSNVLVENIAHLELHDRPLQVGLNKVLDHSLNEGQWKPVELTVRLNTGGKHKLLVSYISGMPTWKPAYRLVMNKTGGKALLQGWAVIDNTSGEDWNNVSLSLSSGAPISFIYDLHKPNFVRRQQMGVMASGALAPVAQAGVAGAKIKESKRSLKARKRRARKGRSKAAAPMNFGAVEAAGFGGLGTRGASIGGGGMSSLDMAQIAGAQDGGATGTAVGGLFRYDVEGPVTVPDRSSTLVSLVNRQIEGEDLLLYRPDAGGAAAQHPYRAVRFKNDTGYMLQGGPVTVLARGTFVGSGIFERIEDGAETFLPFSLEQGISITSHAKHGEKPLKLVAVTDGRVRCEVQSRRTQVFDILSRAKDVPERIYLRVGKRPGWSLENAPKDTRELHGAWYVPATLKEGKTTVEITDLHSHARTVSWDSQLGQDVLKLYVSDAEADSEVAAALKAVDSKRSELSKVRAEVAQKRKRKNELEREQNRVRHNIKTLGEAKINQSLARKFSAQLGANERTIAGLNGDIVKLDEQIHALTQQLKVLMQGVSLSK